VQLPTATASFSCRIMLVGLYAGCGCARIADT
jgi:hypothetical protein